MSGECLHLWWEPETVYRRSSGRNDMGTETVLLLTCRYCEQEWKLPTTKLNEVLRAHRPD